MISGMAFAVIVWCVDANGPVFVSMFRPVRLVVVVIVASLILQEPIYSGRYKSSSSIDFLRYHLSNRT